MQLASVALVLLYMVLPAAVRIPFIPLHPPASIFWSNRSHRGLDSLIRVSAPLSLAVLRPCPTRAAAAPRRRRALVGPDGLRRAPRRLRLLGLLGGPSVRRPHARSQPHARSGLPMRRVHGLARARRRAARGARAAAPRCGLPVRRLREHLRAGVAMRRGVSRRFFPRHGRGGRTSPRPIAEGCTVFGLA